MKETNTKEASKSVRDHEKSRCESEVSNGAMCDKIAKAKSTDLQPGDIVIVKQRRKSQINILCSVSTHAL